MWKGFDVSLLDDVMSWHGLWVALWEKLVRRRPSSRMSDRTQAVHFTHSAG